jgi:hypothetical protein
VRPCRVVDQHPPALIFISNGALDRHSLARKRIWTKMVELSNIEKNNLDYFSNYIDKLKSDNLIDSYSVVTSKEGEQKTKLAIKATDGRNISIETNLRDEYKAVFENYYEEWTDYLADGSNFKSLVDWLAEFVNAYVKREYIEEVYTKKDSGDVVYKKLIFNNPNLGRRHLISYPPHFFLIKRALGRYDKSTRSAPTTK